ncbi:glycosyltransferase family 9 protein [Campylobacter armoricus]|nr:glycosyltransferase family 9 protein [Campylobacter armoricus]
MIVSLDMLYAIKHIYHAKVIVFCRKNTENILKNFDFIDNIELIDKIDKNIIPQINKYPIDYLISFHAKSFLIKLLINTNTKYIIVKAKFVSIFSLKCKTIFTSITKRFFKNRSDRDRMLYYARKINSSIFDIKIKNLEFKTQIQTNAIHKILINDFLRKNEIKNFVILNPFSITSKHTLDIISFLKLAKNIKKNYQNISIVIPTYELVHDDFIDEIHKYDKNLLEEIIVFKNNSDILNLAELISRSKCIISPSTGAIHIATNLKIPSIALYPPKDEIFWPTYNKDYIIITKTQNNLREDEKQEFIENITKRLKKYL